MSRLRIGVDARELVGHATGVGRYLGGLLAEWARTAPAAGHQFVIYTHEPLALTLGPGWALPRVVPGLGGTWWEQVTLPAAAAADALDVFFSPAYTAPLRLEIPVVVAIHDISFIAHPEWFTMREGLRRRWLTSQSAQRASHIVTISQFTRRELIDRLAVAAGRIAVIPPGITGITVTGDSIGPQSSPLTRSDDGARTGGVLFVGSIFNRRRVPDLIRGFAPLARAHPELALDIVGDNRSYPHEDLLGLIAREQLESQVAWRSYVSDERLHGLYESARAFAFLSEYEGLGLTPLEALSAGVPVVLLDTPVARESCGNAALYVEPGDISGLTAALRTLLFDDDVRTRHLTAAPHVLARFDWATAARDTLAVLVAAAEGRRR